MPLEYLWLFPLAAVCITSAWFAKLYREDGDKRKLMFSIVFALASFDYTAMLLDLYPNPNVVFSNIYMVASIPLQIAIFLAVIETIYKIENFDKVFRFFLVMIFFLFLFSLLPFSIRDVLLPVRQILAIEIIGIAFYSFLKNKNESAFLFGMSIICFIVASIGMRYNIFGLDIFSFTVAFVFLSIIFKRAAPREGLESYFSLKRKLEEAERKLRLSEEKYRIIVEHTSDVIVLSNLDGTITYVSPSCRNLFGYEPSEFVGKMPWQTKIIHPEDVEMVRSFHHNVKIGRVSKPIEFRIITKNGKIRWVSLSVSPVREDGKVIMFISSYRDVTERKEMEQQLSLKVEELERAKRAYLNIMEDLRESIEKLRRAREEIRKKNKELEELNRKLEEKVRERTSQVEKLLKEKEELLIQISHDIKTPLTPLCTLLPLVRERVKDPKAVELLDICIKNANYMKKLITDTLQLLKTDKTKLSMENLNLKEQVEEIIENHKMEMSKKNMDVKISIDKNIFVRADRIRLREIFDNLISNAIKYSPDGGMIHIGAEREDGMVKIFVRDKGKGMTKEQMEHVFDEFYKADRSGHDLSSVGVGLSICKKLVEKHGGKIWVESAGPGKGSTFYFTLPAASEKMEKVESVVKI